MQTKLIVYLTIQPDQDGDGAMYLHTDPIVINSVQMWAIHHTLENGKEGAIARQVFALHYRGFTNSFQVEGGETPHHMNRAKVIVLRCFGE